VILKDKADKTFSLIPLDVWIQICIDDTSSGWFVEI